MAYRRKRRYRRRPRRMRRRFRVRRNFTGRPELKFHDTEFNGTTVAVTPQTHDLFDPALGTAGNQRIGRVCFLKYIKVQLYFKPSAVDGNNMFRVIIGQFPRKRTPLDHTDLTTDGYPSNMYSGTPYALGVKHYVHKFISLNATNDYGTGAANGPGIVVKQLNKRIRCNRYVQYDSSSNPVGGFLFLYVQSDSGGVPNPTFSGNIRCYYYDA